MFKLVKDEVVEDESEREGGCKSVDAMMGYDQIRIINSHLL